MTDMLQMSYSEMESLAAAFESASNHLKQMGKAATVLMIQEIGRASCRERV